MLGWKELGYEKKLNARIVNYADDFVILCVNQGQEVYTAMKRMMEKLGLKVNEGKTRLCQVPKESFEFLGYSFGRCYSTKSGKVYIGTRPSQKKVKGIIERISQRTGRETLKQETTEKVRELNDNGNPSGLGNLIIGYDEGPDVLGLPALNAGDRGGSHNLIIGRGNRFTNLAFGGLVAGELNTISAEGNTVSGGFHNTASILSATVSGGFNNTAGGEFATVSGGQLNAASGTGSTVNGGFDNTAGGQFTVVIGGQAFTDNRSFSIAPNPPFP